MSKEQWQILIEGKVQGVSYRAAAQASARELDITGYARNLADGRVEIQAQGHPDSLEQLVDWCWQGSPASEVENVKVRKSAESDDFSDFTTA